MLLTSTVPRGLEQKTRLFGFELGDLLLVFSYLAATNLIFGMTCLKIPVVWGGTIFLGVTLHFLKRGKPDRYLEHLISYLRTPDALSATAPDTKYTPYRQK